MRAGMTDSLSTRTARQSIHSLIIRLFWRQA
jgi:hypothetical protein